MALIDVIGLVVFTVIGASPIYLYYRQQKKDKLSWQRIATQNGLSYKTRKYFNGGDFIIGVYRGHRLKIESKDLGQSATKISIKLNDGWHGEDTHTVDDIADIFLSEFQFPGKIYMGRNGRFISYIQYRIETDEQRLQSIIDVCCQVLETYDQIIRLGGEVVPILQKTISFSDDKLHPVATQLLSEISTKTTTELGNRLSQLVCCQCFLKFESLNLYGKSSLRTGRYIGCRGCHQSRDFFEGAIGVVFDVANEQLQYEKNGILWVNWIHYQKVFDFDLIHIIQASDQDIERFVIQIGNDSDKHQQKKRYSQACFISPSCQLSANTMHILKSMFGEVEVKTKVIAEGLLL